MCKKCLYLNKNILLFNIVINIVIYLSQTILCVVRKIDGKL